MNRSMCGGLLALVCFSMGCDVEGHSVPDAGSSVVPDSGFFNTAPVFELLPDTIGTEEVSFAGSFIVSDAETPAEMLQLSATSSDESMVPNDQIVLIPNPGQWVVWINPVVDAAGSVTITLTASDGQLTTSETFEHVISDVNDPPSFTTGGDVDVAINAGSVSLPWAIDVSPGNDFESEQAVLFVVASVQDPALFDVQPSMDASGVLSFTPKYGAFGTTSVAVTAEDSGGESSATEVFNISLSCQAAAPPASDFFVGSYSMVQDSGSDPFYASETFGDSQTVSIVADGHERSFDFSYFPGIFNSDYGFRMNLCDGEIFVRGRINSGGLGCPGSAHIGFGTLNPAATYEGDDSVLKVDVLDFDPPGDCDESPYPVSLTFSEVP